MGFVRAVFGRVALAAALAAPCAGMAGQLSLLRQASLAQPRAPLIVFGPKRSADGHGSAGSLFAGQRGGGLFAPLPNRNAAPVAPARGDVPLRGDGQIAGLLALIARAEAGPHGYDAVQLGARVRPPAPPTRLTLAQIFQWIDDTPGQPHAIGRYQVIPATLQRLAKRAGLGPQTVFSPAVQDRLAGLLLDEAGIAAFRAGGIGRQAFMDNLAKIWAGLPSSDGLSHYHGVAGNRAVLTRARFDAEMARIFPDQAMPRPGREGAAS